MSEQTINKRAILKYVALPGIKPRFMELFGKGFHYIPYFIALVYECVRLIPKGHPYLNANNIGRFGVRHVIAEAANNLVLDKKNLDQIAVFSLILIAMIIVCVQIVLVFVALFMQPGMAFPVNFNQFFLPGGYPGTATEQDIALILLDMVFGVPEMFESCVDQVANAGASCNSTEGIAVEMPAELAGLLSSPGPGVPNFTHWAVWPYPIHEGLHQLFAVYSYGLLIIAVFITIYFMMTVVAETAQTGTAFGKRFNKVWAPIRIVVAFGLLVPITLGMNSGQFIVLYAAKFGSGFASNGWAYFNASFTTDHHMEGWKELVSVPNVPEFGGLAQFFLAAATCKSAYMLDQGWTENHADEFHIAPYLIRETGAVGASALPLTNPGGDIPGFGAITGATTYDEVRNVGGFSYRSNRMVLRFGHQSEKDYGGYLGNVKPICGEIVLNMEDSREPGAAEPGAEAIQRYYWWLVKALWWSEGRLEPYVGTPRYSESFAKKMIPGLEFNAGTDLLPTGITRQYMMERLNMHMNDVLTGSGGPNTDNIGAAVDVERASARWDMTPELMAKGWAGAAIWYSKIAQMNGAVTSATYNVPIPSAYPWLMEFTAEQQREQNQNVTADDRFNPFLADGQRVNYPTEKDGRYAAAMYEAYKFWSDASSGASTQTDPTGNIIIDAFNLIMGTEGLFDMRKNTDVHPLAQLVGIGRSLVESSIRNIGYAAVGAGAGFITKTLEQFSLAALAGTASSFLITIAMVALTAGFILYYIVPFLPFIYFFFAVGGWVKGIFEAMVGVPLWALAHIRIDGEGLSGQAAINGYFLIFEIFLRPILIIFGFLASILIFSALVEVLNEIFDLVVANVGGFDVNEEANDTAGTGISYMDFYRTAVDEFFFTIIYAVVVYMIGQSCFKLIDQIPNNILRWMNQNVATFNDSREDPAQGLVGTAQMGAQQGLQSMGGGLQKMVGVATG